MRRKGIGLFLGLAIAIMGILFFGLIGIIASYVPLLKAQQVLQIGLAADDQGTVLNVMLEAGTEGQKNSVLLAQWIVSQEFNEQQLDPLKKELQLLFGRNFQFTAGKKILGEQAVPLGSEKQATEIPLPGALSGKVKETVEIRTW